MTIANMMQDRAALTAQLDAIPDDLASEPAFKETFARRWAVEESILAHQAVTVAELRAQHATLAARARDGGDVARDLERLAR
jgi:hypothetical protein